VVVSLRETTTLQLLETEVLVAGQTAQTLEQQARPWRLCKAGMVALEFLPMLVVVAAEHQQLVQTVPQELQGLVVQVLRAACLLCLLISAVVVVVG
jgi:hypothetical protein